MSPLREIRPSTEEERQAANWKKSSHYLVDEEVKKLRNITDAMDKGNGVAALVYEGEREGTVLYDEVFVQQKNLQDEIKFELGKIIETEILDNRGIDGKVTLLIKEFPHDLDKKK